MGSAHSGTVNAEKNSLQRSRVSEATKSRNTTLEELLLEGVGTESVRDASTWTSARSRN